MARRSNELLTIAEIDAFAAKLKATVKAAQAADEFRAWAAKLAGGQAPSAPRTTTRKTASRKGRARKPALDTAAVYQVIAGAKDGIAVSEVAKKVGQDKPRVAAALRKLRDEKKIKLKGEKRLARWYPA